MLPLIQVEEYITDEGVSPFADWFNFRKVADMPLTQDFKKTIQARAVKDEAFREGLLRESIECMLADDVQTGKALLRDYINATTGFEKLARMTHKDAKSVMRMLSASGNPTANNLFDILHVLQKKEGVHYELQPAA